MYPLKNYPVREAAATYSPKRASDDDVTDIGSGGFGLGGSAVFGGGLDPSLSGGGAVGGEPLPGGAASTAAAHSVFGAARGRCDQIPSTPYIDLGALRRCTAEEKCVVRLYAAGLHGNAGGRCATAGSRTWCRGRARVPDLVRDLLRTASAVFALPDDGDSKDVFHAVGRQPPLHDELLTAAKLPTTGGGAAPTPDDDTADGAAPPELRELTDGSCDEPVCHIVTFKTGLPRGVADPDRGGRHRVTADRRRQPDRAHRARPRGALVLPAA